LAGTIGLGIQTGIFQLYPEFGDAEMAVLSPIDKQTENKQIVSKVNQRDNIIQL
jgi:hypothetical protein